MSGRYVLGYAVGSLVVMLSAFGWAWRWQGKSFTLSALCGLPLRDRWHIGRIEDQGHAARDRLRRPSRIWEFR
ncbi:hypothetical protein [Variovorax ginsengisoli]|uniref:Uncharacterized protein n=1 Tax=Variovorax ginsengisoli TaxID=363844 RepID=A0ABT8SGG6_9BURK|nr:hypothetical protein [Variovorax ginsengisoli]MDN8618655.1 hypothetical protein [Variovorax ginsengisoli]MDO1537825.1 hypothetical protein [Variovorax ginsengisoli]